MANPAGKAARKLRAREYQKQVLALRLTGATFSTIGKQLGFSEVMALKYYRAALAAVPAPEVAQERIISLERIENAEFILNYRIEALRQREPTPETCDVIARLSMAVWRWEQRRAQLLGLDSPAKIALAA